MFPDNLDKSWRTVRVASIVTLFSPTLSFRRHLRMGLSEVLIPRERFGYPRIDEACLHP